MNFFSVVHRPISSIKLNKIQQNVYNLKINAYETGFSRAWRSIHGEMQCNRAVILLAVGRLRPLMRGFKRTRTVLVGATYYLTDDTRRIF